MAYPRHLLLLAPLTRLEPPGWINLLQRLGAFRERGWEDAPVRRVRDKWHRYTVQLDLRYVSDRAVYFGGRYLETETQRVVKALLRDGETLVDVGANTGMITLMGARAVGPRGRVHAFEPNPPVFRRLKANVEANPSLGAFVTLHNAGLGESEGELELHVDVGNPDMATFGAGLKAEYEGHGLQGVRCRVARGDGELAGLPGANTLIKIDVEGFETAVLRGLASTMERLRPAVLTEVEPELLQKSGSSPRELAGLMEAWGYRGYWCCAWETRPRSFIRWAYLRRVGSITDGVSRNVLWVVPGSVFEERVAAMVRT